MRAPASRSNEYCDYEELLPGERICPPRAGTGGKAILRALIILIALGGGWAVFGDQGTWREWLSAKIAAVSSAINSRAPGTVEPRTSAATATSAPARIEPTTTRAALDAPSSAASSPMTAALPQAATAYEPLPNQSPADPADPYRQRAEAAGLHPGLSRVLLERLSPTDYRNAGIAIQTALAETPDGGVFVWPRQRVPELALFQVRFVQGAAAGCRRYVVTVTKDRWLTTALPMEKCGQSGHPQR